MQISNDINGENVFTLAVKRQDNDAAKVIFQVMKNLSEMIKEKLNAACEFLPLVEIMKRKNAHVE